MSKNYTFQPPRIGIWNCTVYKMDDDGNTLNNPDGTVKLFRADDVDMGYWADGVEEDDLSEIEEQEDE